jgi:hypothetical protein
MKRIGFIKMNEKFRELYETILMAQPKFTPDVLNKTEEGHYSSIAIAMGWCGFQFAINNIDKINKIIKADEALDEVW